MKNKNIRNILEIAEAGPAEKIKSFDQQTMQDIRTLIKAAEGTQSLSLSGPDIGITKRIIVVNQEKPIVMINPELSFGFGESIVEESVPGSRRMFQKRLRAKDIKVDYQDMQGKKSSIYLS